VRDADKPRSFSARLQLIEETIPSMLIEVLALQLTLKLLFDVDADMSDADEARMPLDVLVAGELDEIIDSMDAEPDDTGEWTRLRAAEAARALLNVSSEFVELPTDDPDGEAHENDNGPR
jgi:hypothetical protein